MTLSRPPWPPEPPRAMRETFKVAWGPHKPKHVFVDRKGKTKPGRRGRKIRRT